MSEAAYYEPLGPGRYRAAPATVSPWDPEAQHGGPPSALLAREVEGVVEQGGRGGVPPEQSGALRIARFSVDFLGPIPRGEVAVEARILRPGRRVQLVEATMTAGDRQVAVARAWRYGHGHTATPVSEHPAPPPLPEARPVRFFPGVENGRYAESVDWRFVAGSYVELGPSQVWARPRIPLVEGQDATPFEQLLIVADSANGLSLELPTLDWISIPTGLTVTLSRHPATGWVFLDTRTTLAGDGIGLTVGELADESGLLGTLAQPLTLVPR
ncbi:MAG: thioesterase family protein [bacterium]|nr:thioesterase family protein [bacterium]